MALSVQESKRWTWILVILGIITIVIVYYFKFDTGSKSSTLKHSVAVTTETVGTSPVTKTVEAGTWSDWIPIPAGYHDTSTASIPQSEESGMKKEYRTQGGIKQIKYGTYFGEHATEVRYYSKQKTSFTVKFVPN